MILNKILPVTANNNFKGYRISLWAFVLFTALMTWRSIIHMFFEEYGLHEIANVIELEGNPDPMPLIYIFFSVWGLAQTIFCIVCWVVITRYRSLIPLMYFLWIIEWGLRAFVYPIMSGDPIGSGTYTDGTTPGHIMAPYITLFLLIFFVISLMQRD